MFVILMKWRGNFKAPSALVRRRCSNNHARFILQQVGNNACTYFVSLTLANVINIIILIINMIKML